MHTEFNSITLSYKKSSIEIREKLSISEREAGEIIKLSQDTLGVQEIMVISTCNRSEIYYSSNGEMCPMDMLKVLGTVKGIFPIQQYISYFDFYTGDDAVRHLFRVSMGLESQVVGDIQISNQIKRSYQLSADLNVAGTFLHRLMHTIFYTNKRVVQETAFRDGAASVSYAATELVEELVEHLKDPRILVLGIGEIGTDMVKNLAKAGFKNVKITNRTFSKAEELAQETPYEAIPFETIWEEIEETDCVVSSVAVADFIKRERIQKMDISLQKYFVDLSVPRSIEKELEELPKVQLYNVDTINKKANKAVEKRKAAIPNVERIIEEMIIEFNSWKQQMSVSPTIHKLKNALEEIRQQEIARYTKQMKDSEEEMVNKVTKGIMQKIMKLPVLQLKAACQRGEADTLVDVLNDLFDLEKQSETIKR